jgi:tRNA 2-thiouridine synthesizing protein C
MNATDTHKLVFIARRSGWTAAAAACLETTLIAGVFEMQPVLVLLDDAVTQLLPEQNGETLGLKTLARQFPALELYGIDTVYVDEVALQERGLADADLLIPVKRLHTGQLATLVAAAATTLVF